MEPIALTIEQQFKLKVLENHVQVLSQKQAQKLLLEAVRQCMIKDNIIRHCKIDDRTPLERF